MLPGLRLLRGETARNAVCFLDGRKPCMKAWRERTELFPKAREVNIAK